MSHQDRLEERRQRVLADMETAAASFSEAAQAFAILTEAHVKLMARLMEGLAAEAETPAARVPIGPPVVIGVDMGAAAGDITSCALVADGFTLTPVPTHKEPARSPDPVPEPEPAKASEPAPTKVIVPEGSPEWLAPVLGRRPPPNTARVLELLAEQGDVTVNSVIYAFSPPMKEMLAQGVLRDAGRALGEIGWELVRDNTGAYLPRVKS